MAEVHHHNYIPLKTEKNQEKKNHKKSGKYDKFIIAFIGIELLLLISVVIIKINNRLIDKSDKLEKTQTIRDKNYEKILKEAEVLQKYVIIELYIAELMEGGWEEIIDTYEATMLFENASVFMVNYLFEDQINHITSLNDVIKNANNLNWKIVKIHDDEDNEWNFKFIHSKNTKEYKVIKRWRNIINRILNWKYRAEKEGLHSSDIKLPSLKVEISSKDSWSFKDIIEYENNFFYK